MSKIEMHDAFVIDGVRRTSDGYLTAFARVARTGIQTYRGYELGRPDLDTVRVYRPPEEVFSADAMRSFAHRPVTLKHPPKPVNDKNWKQYAGGHTGEEVVRDGDFVRVPMVMMDARLIDAYEKQGIDQLSMGYSTDIQWRQGVTDAGEAYDAVQTSIRANHLALVPVARGGDRLRVGDRDFSAKQREKAAGEGEAMPDGSFPIKNRGDLENAIHLAGRAKDPEAARAFIKRRAKALGAEDLLPTDWMQDSDDEEEDCPDCGATMHNGKCPECGYTEDGEPEMKTIVIDGLNVQVGDDQSASIVQRHIDTLTKRLADADAEMEKKKKQDEELDKELGDAKAAVSAKDGEIAVLKQKLADAEITPAKLDVMVKDRMSVIDAARALLPKEFAFDGKTLGDIRKAAVQAKLGDAAAKMDDAAIGGAFSALTVDAPKGNTSAAIVDAFASRRPGPTTHAQATDAAYDEYTKTLGDAWRAKTA